MSTFPKPSTQSTPDKPAAVAESTQPDKRVGLDETSYLLQRYLLPQHQTDPNVINFIKHYLNCRSAKQAAHACNLTTSDGNNLLRRPDIHTTIKKITEKALLKHGYDAGEVIERVKEIMRIDPVDLEREDGTYVTSLKEVDPETRRAIKKFKAKNFYTTDPNGMKVLAGQIIEVEFWDKMKAVELLGREKDIFKETKKVTHDLTANMSSVLLESKRRAEEASMELAKDVTPQVTYREVEE